MSYHIDEGYYPYATERQKELLDAYLDSGGNAEEAGRAMGVKGGQIRAVIQRVREKAHAKGYSPAHQMWQPLPEGQTVKGVSRDQNPDGSLNHQWIKSTREGKDPDEADFMPDPKTIKRQARLLDADGKVIQHWITEEPEAAKRVHLLDVWAKALSEDIPRVPPAPEPATSVPALCNVYTLTDLHMGMYAWHEEGNKDWDLNIAQMTATNVFAELMHSAPGAEVGVIAQLGDLLHYDSLNAVTPTSGHILDADTRFEKMVRYAAKTMRTLVDMALQKHEEVHVIMAEGNHDMASSAWLRTFFAMLYENEPRVAIDTSAKPYYCLQHGKVMLMWHHGHLSKNDQLPMIAASEFPEVWGDTTKRYAHSGDKHHKEMRQKEYAGMLVEQHTTLAARDAYASRHGWSSERSASAITYHAGFGEVGRVTVTPEMVTDL